MKPIPVTDDITWLGVHDPSLEAFEVVLPTPWGSTYNSYLIQAEKPTLVETVKVNFREEFLEKLKSLIDPLALQYVILNHTEADHSGALPWVVEAAPNARVVTSRAAERYTAQLFPLEREVIAVGDGDILDLGDRELSFVSAPYLHWPDTMFTYSPRDRALFTCDAFGVHFCAEEALFDDDAGDFAEPYRYYYDNIMRPFKEKVVIALDKIAGLEVDVICTGHGPVLRSAPQKYFELYRQWSEEAEESDGRPLVAVFYVGGEGNVAQMADQIARGLAAGGTAPVVRDAETATAEEVGALLEISGGALFGVPAAGREFKTLEAVLSAVSEANVGGEAASAFGPYGTVGETVKVVESRLREAGAKIVKPPLAVDFAPDEEVFQRCREFGLDFASAVAGK
ncbi:MAG: FprA family A-type flavoprotein [Candidatus Coatesbacteria bacterium]|nr:MAG: FprA family A-type flavoprotein [Candidatus Coatesbacteria bacterium]